MDFSHTIKPLDEVVPGVSAAYEALRNSHGQGIYTSLGRFYNHTIFGRDVGMSAKFVTDFDHEIAWQTILTLASHQGVVYDRTTQEERGRIHHELRDYTTWHGGFYNRLGLKIAGAAWGMRNKQLLTYFAADTTATYIRLVHKYAQHLDASVLDRKVPQKDGQIITLRESVQHAVDWLVSQIDENGLFRSRRLNRWSLPYQTFADSVTAYAWQNGRPADTAHDHSFVEVQAYVLDALQDAAQLFDGDAHAEVWRDIADLVHKALFDQFWSEDKQVFAPGIFRDKSGLKKLDTDMISSGWVLNASFWHYMSDSQHHSRLIGIVDRLFRDDFLTDVGIRTKSIRTKEPLGKAIDYHGSRTVWPMFNFMVIEGLRRHGLDRLAAELEARIINGINALGTFPEFFVVEHDGTLYRPEKHALKHRQGQMIPEANIAFTIVPALAIAYRHRYVKQHKASLDSQRELEDAILARIPHIELLQPSDAAGAFALQPIRIDRTWCGIRSAMHVAPVILRKV